MTFSGLSNDVQVQTYAVSAQTFLVMPGSGHVLQNVTMSASATVTVVPGNWIGQFMILNICQDGTGGWTPTINHTVGITIKGGLPTWTTTASKCDILGMMYTKALVWQITGYILNE